MNQDSERLKRNYVRCIENVKLLETEVAKRDFIQAKSDTLIYILVDSLKDKNLYIGELKTKVKRKNKHIIQLLGFNILALFGIYILAK